MTEATAIFAQAVTLLTYYGFDLSGTKTEELVAEWLVQYPGYWLRLAIVEALYQGRYKAVSVGHILEMWLRRGQPFYHFNHEFERLVCSSFAQEAGEGETKPQEGARSIDVESNPLPESSLLPVWKPPVSVSQAPVKESLKISKFPPPNPTSENLESSLPGWTVPEATPATLPVENKASKLSETLANELKEKSEDKPTGTIKHTDFHSKLKAVAQVPKPEEGRRRRGRSSKR